MGKQLEASSWQSPGSCWKEQLAAGRSEWQFLGEMGQVRVCWGRENPLELSGILSVDRESERYMEGMRGGKRIQE